VKLPVKSPVARFYFRKFRAYPTSNILTNSQKLK